MKRWMNTPHHENTVLPLRFGHGCYSNFETELQIARFVVVGLKMEWQYKWSRVRLSVSFSSFITALSVAWVRGRYASVESYQSGSRWQVDRWHQYQPGWIRMRLVHDVNTPPPWSHPNRSQLHASVPGAGTATIDQY